MKRSRHGAGGVAVIVEAETEGGSTLLAGLTRCWAKRVVLRKRLEATVIDTYVRLMLCRPNGFETGKMVVG